MLFFDSYPLYELINDIVLLKLFLNFHRLHLLFVVFHYKIYYLHITLFLIRFPPTLYGCYILR